MSAITRPVDTKALVILPGTLAGEDGALRKKALEAAAPILREDIRHQFQSGGIPAWQALSPATIAAKRAAGYPRKPRRGEPSAMLQNGKFGPENILMRTGALFESWTDVQNPFHIETITEDSITLGSDLPYAAVHQMGGGRVPRRPVRITEDGATRAAEAIANTLSKEAHS